MSEHRFFNYPFNKILSLRFSFKLNISQIGKTTLKSLIFFWILKALNFIFAGQAGVAQLVERQPSKLNVAGSNPVSRSTRNLNGNVGVFLWKKIKIKELPGEKFIPIGTR